MDLDPVGQMDHLCCHKVEIIKYYKILNIFSEISSNLH
jgi:hypothetical protein